jgi:hypothetical protein
MYQFISPLIAAAVIFSLSLIDAAPACALSHVTFVSGKGVDTGPCDIARPCQSFQFAIGQTEAYGLIKVLDPADFGSLTITKSISIEGIEGAAIGGFDANGIAITVKAGPKDVINISRLVVDGRNAGGAGIQTSSFGSLTITHCAVRNFRGDGIDIFSGSGKVFLISDVVVSDNGRLGLDLVGVPGTLDHVMVNHNGIANPCGFFCGGIRAAEGPAVVSIIDSTVVNNSSSINSEDGATIRLFHSFVPDGILSGALSAGNNFVDKTLGLTEVGTH